MILHIHPSEIPSKTGKNLVETLVAKHNEIVVRFNEKTTEEWRKIIDNKELTTIVAPVYWWGLSHEFEKWLQDTFSLGWAYDYNKMPTGLLQGRIIAIHLTHGTPTAYCEDMFANITERLEKGVFGYCGIEIEVHFHAAMHE